MKIIHILISLLLLICYTNQSITLEPDLPETANVVVTTTKDQTPAITVVIIIDQFAYHYLYKLKPYLTGGIKDLLENGVVYKNAHHPHAMPETATGHATLSTGTYPKDHGIISNAWYDLSGKEVEADDDDATSAAVFGPQGMYTYGKGPKNIMVDGLSDQFVMQSKPNEPHYAYALSIKSRAVIATANKLGKAIWFDKKTGRFTSSKSYFNELPEWLISFNTRKKLDTLETVRWDLAYKKHNHAYDFFYTNNYRYSQIKQGIIGTLQHIDKTAENPYEPLYTSPMGNALELDLATTCIQNVMTGRSKLLLWLSLSPLDLLGHIYGPDSLEAIDMVYHLDLQLKKFITYVQKKVGKDKALFVLTADHGVSPIQGILREEGLKTTYKLMYKDFISNMNALINQKYNVENLVNNYQGPTFYYDQATRKSLDAKTYKNITRDLKEYLMEQPGIKKAWTNKELDRLPYLPTDLEYFYKNQRYPGRSGELVVQLQPYTLMTKYPEGTSHETPYNYDTHVPLVIYQEGKFEHKTIFETVFTTQVANTLAQILHIPKPSASTAALLPKMFK